jgi:hypothetical protein
LQEGGFPLILEDWMNRRLLRFLKGLSLVILISLAGLYVAAEWVFNVNSNAVMWAVSGSGAGLEVRLKGGEWKALAEVSAAELQGALVDRYQETGMQWKKLRVRRSAGGVAAVLQTVFGAEVHVMTIAPERFEFSTSYLPEFAGTTARERLKTEGLQFAITANFREPSGAPMGWVWHDGRQVHKPFPEWSGVFFVKEGRPWFGPKSLLDEVPGVITEGAQVYPSVMKNHTVFNYVFNAPDRFFDGPKITYRSLAGMRQNGEVVFILSGDGGVMNVKEVTDMAQKLAVQHATLLDGGRALQYSVRTEDGPWHFAAFNTRMDFATPKLERQRSPVFIAVRRRPPSIRAQGLSGDLEAGAAP